MLKQGLKLFIAVTLLFWSAPASLAADSTEPTVTIKEWQVPWANSRPRDPYATDGKIWFVGQVGHYMAHFEPQSETFGQVKLDEGTGPHNLIVDSDDTVWYAGNLKSHIGWYKPNEGVIHKIAMPDPSARDPHTLVFAPENKIWFTVQNGNFIGRLDKVSKEVELIPVPTERARPYGIVIAPDGRPWIALFGSNKLASVDPVSLALSEVELPRQEARPRRIAVTADGMIWYVDYAQGYLGRVDPKSGAVKEWPMPAGNRSRPYAMAVDKAGRVWAVETGITPNRFVAFDPSSESFVAMADVPSGGGTVRHMHYHGQSNSIWFGADTGTIGVARINERD